MSLGQSGLLTFLSVLWGGSFFFQGVATREFAPLTIAAARVSLGALTLWFILRASGQRLPRTSSAWRALLLSGVLANVIPFTLFAWAQSVIASSVASILNAMTPIFTVLVAHLLTSNEKLTAGRMLGVLLGFSGVTVMIGGGRFDLVSNHSLAYAACLGAAGCYALAAVHGRRFAAMGQSPLQTASAQLIASSAILLPLALIIDQPWLGLQPSLPAGGALVGLAVLSTALANLVYFRLLSTAGATNIVLVTFLIPVSAMAMGVLFLGDVLEARHGLGVALIFAGLAAIDGRLLRSRNHQS